MVRPPIACAWLRELAAGYLREFTSVASVRSGGLWGYRFQPGRLRAGFFVGFLTGTSRKISLRLKPPECLVAAFVAPPLRARLVRRAASPFRRSYDLVTKYTARRPRFEFHQREALALVRHVPLAAFPPRERAKYARNFFMETLALLVRSGLPEALFHAQRGRRGRG